MLTDMTNGELNKTTETRCLRCHRVLRSAASISAMVGKGCAAKIRQAAITEARADFSPDQQAKADELIRDGGIVPLRMTARNGMLFRAVSSRGDESYLVTANGCACKARRACYHQLGAKVLNLASRRPVSPVTVPSPSPVPDDDFTAEMERLTACFMAMA